ncbi:uncharacterized protein LOC128558265 [Mercenaria mercenaria]|uniref:uncharacterized protein LOC128558265 n=1 Tax=Mercenaria mercenaria TaxID=6596 RepID=UPI00234F6815|nr:uncharacterized protein LOC128558265 [Mercenaria mercenaria]
MSVEDESIVKQVKSTITRSEGHYQVSIPWNDKKPSLKNNYEMALHRLRNTEKKIEKDPVLKEAYKTTLQKYLNKGYITEVNLNETFNDSEWYIPHFPIVKLDRETTKVRIVFDAAAKTDGLSLNEAIYQGPKLQNELFDVLLRFRSQPIAIMCDIEEMTHV